MLTYCENATTETRVLSGDTEKRLVSSFVKALASENPSSSTLAEESKTVTRSVALSHVITALPG